MTLKDSVKSTLKYANFFDYPLTLVELHHWLITSKIVPISKIVRFHHFLKPISQKRLNRQLYSQEKIVIAQKYTNFLKKIPWIYFVGITGSLSMNNARKNDDIDLFIITKTNRLWITRLIVLLVSKFFFKVRSRNDHYHKNSLCVNLWLDQSALTVPETKRNLYTAHEVLQVKPLFDKSNTYKNFLSSNSWTRHYLANAYQAHNNTHSTINSHPSKSFFVDLLNLLFFQLQYLYMKSKITNETISLNSAYFHPRDLYKSIKRKIINSS